MRTPTRHLLAVVAVALLGGCDDSSDPLPPPTTSSSTSSTFGPTTTSTFPEETSTTLEPNLSTLVFRVVSASAPIGALQFRADYSQSGGEVAGTGPTAQCTNEVAGTIFSVFDDDAQQDLGLAWVSLSGFTVTRTLTLCGFHGVPEPDPSKIAITIVDAAGVDLQPVEVEVVAGWAGPDIETTTTSRPDTTTSSTTTTSTTTSTTLEDPPDPERFVIVFELAAAGARVGALQVDVDYADAPGEFTGSGATVECRAPLTNAITVFNDIEHLDLLTLGVVSLKGVAAGATLARCEFRTAGAAPVPDQFDIIVTDASDTAFQPVEVDVTVRVERGQ